MIADDISLRDRQGPTDRIAIASTHRPGNILGILGGKTSGGMFGAISPLARIKIVSGTSHDIAEITLSCRLFRTFKAQELSKAVRY